MRTNESQETTFMGFTVPELVRIRRLCSRAGGLDELECVAGAAEAAQERARALRSVRTPENLYPHLAAITERPSDLRKAMGHGWASDQLARFRAHRRQYPLWWVMWALLVATHAPWLIAVIGG